MKYIPKALPANSTDFLSNSFGQNIIQTFSRRISRSFIAQILLFNLYKLESHVLDTLKSKLSVPIDPVGLAIPHISLEKAPKDPYYIK